MGSNAPIWIAILVLGITIGVVAMYFLMGKSTPPTGGLSAAEKKDIEDKLKLREDEITALKAEKQTLDSKIAELNSQATTTEKKNRETIEKLGAALHRVTGGYEPMNAGIIPVPKTAEEIIMLADTTVPYLRGLARSFILNADIRAVRALRELTDLRDNESIIQMLPDIEVLMDENKVNLKKAGEEKSTAVRANKELKARNSGLQSRNEELEKLVDATLAKLKSFRTAMADALKDAPANVDIAGAMLALNTLMEAVRGKIGNGNRGGNDKGNRGGNDTDAESKSTAKAAKRNKEKDNNQKSADKTDDDQDGDKTPAGT